MGFYFRNKSCFSFETKRRLVAATFLSVLDYGDVIYMNASITSLKLLDTVYHGALRFITNFRALTHQCSLYDRVGWSALSTRRLNHWYIFIYKAILGLLPPYHQSISKRKVQEDIVFVLRTYYYYLSLKSGPNWEKGRSSMRPPALVLNLKEPVSLVDFKLLWNNMEATQICCRCYDWLSYDGRSLLLLIACDNMWNSDFLWLYNYLLLVQTVICFYVCNLVNCAAACLGQDALGKEIFNLNLFYSG